MAIYLGLTVLLLALGLQRTGGTFVYAQDDPYIHLALARTLAEHGVWGVRPDEFASASSSPLWTLLMAASWKLGLQTVWWPFVVNIACGAGLIVFLDRVLRPRLRSGHRLTALAAVILVTPLPTLALIGMEHTLQVLLVVSFAWSIASLIERDDRAGRLAACILAMLLVATRYEGLFVVAAAALVLARCRRRGIAVALCAVALVPVAISGAYFMAQGGGLLPNSVLMKSLPGRFATVGSGIAAVLADWVAVVALFNRTPELTLTLGVLLALAVAWRGQSDAWTRSTTVGAMFVITVLLHTALVKLEWFFRYEAYLMALGILALALLAADDRAREAVVGTLKRNVAGALVLVLLALPLATRALWGLAVTPGAMRNVFEQQYQMAQFFQRAYPNDTIALNDIGAVSWVSSSRMVDVYGLATQEVADLKRRREWNPDALESIVARRNVRAVAIYEKVFATLIPRSWMLVGEWQIRDNVGVSEDTVEFFAPTPGDAARLRAALDDYAPRLPTTVTYRVTRP
ncbi:MAG: hypothetical protein M3O78_00940 [Chloroflexota bacterium]|nr:hypothetical protein [Chloroflexota bacterium]